MKELIVGSGGREHAIAWKLHQDHPDHELFVAPGNKGISEIATNVPIAAENIDGLTSWAKSEKINLAIIGPEVPLSKGITDRMQQAGIEVFGPSQQASQIEASKAFAKEFMANNGIPTAKFKIFTSFHSAISHLHFVDYPVVIKASGLASGKGVVVPMNTQEGEAALSQMMQEKKYKEAGETVIIEERLDGEEVSVLAFSDGHTVRVMPPARDHKRLETHDKGPNTGGMGAYAPVELSGEVRKIIKEDVLDRTVKGLALEARPFVGVLYAGIMLTKDGPKVLEFNCRFGDPETQVILPLMETPIAEVAQASIEGNLDKVDVRWKSLSAVSVSLAAKGYPEKPETGEVIHGLSEINDGRIIIFHAGTKQVSGELIVNGGRVLNVTAVDSSVLKAQRRAYSVIGLGKVYFNGMQYRRDIGNSGIR